MAVPLTKKNHYYPRSLIKKWGNPLFRIYKERGVIGSVSSSKSVLYQEKIFGQALENAFSKREDREVAECLDTVNPFNDSTLSSLNTPTMVRCIYWLLFRAPRARKVVEKAFLDHCPFWDLIGHPYRQEGDTTYTQRIVNTELYNSSEMPPDFSEKLYFIVNQTETLFVLPDDMRSFVVLSPRLLVLYGNDPKSSPLILRKGMEEHVNWYNAQFLKACERYVLSASKSQLEGMKALCLPREVHDIALGEECYNPGWVGE